MRMESDCLQISNTKYAMDASYCGHIILFISTFITFNTISSIFETQTCVITHCIIDLHDLFTRWCVCTCCNTVIVHADESYRL